LVTELHFLAHNSLGKQLKSMKHKGKQLRKLKIYTNICVYT
jgi:hypothetical protein